MVAAADGRCPITRATSSGHPFARMLWSSECGNFFPALVEDGGPCQQCFDTAEARRATAGTLSEVDRDVFNWICGGAEQGGLAKERGDELSGKHLFAMKTLKRAGRQGGVRHVLKAPHVLWLSSNLDSTTKFNGRKFTNSMSAASGSRKVRCSRISTRSTGKWRRRRATARRSGR